MAITGYEKPRLEDYTLEELKEIAASYTISHSFTKNNQTSNTYSRLTKSQLISLIRNDDDYKDANPKDFRRRPQQIRNRIRPILEDLRSVSSPDKKMNMILEVIENTNRGMTPQAGKYYTFIYYAETPKLLYDKHPLIKAGDLLPKGFRGFNYHLGSIKQYNTEGNGDRLVTGLYEVSIAEFDLLRKVAYQNLIKNR
ncbi:MAG: hypothetical protein ACO3UU_08235 [Minisyncoccia bacterium]